MIKPEVQGLKKVLEARRTCLAESLKNREGLASERKADPIDNALSPMVVSAALDRLHR